MRICVGIDVAEERKGLDLVALDSDRRVGASLGRATITQVTTMIAELRPEVVCIDSPPAWAANGRSRAAERELRRFGVTAFSTPTDPGPHSFYRWMRVGFSIFAAIADSHPRFRAGPVEGTAAEVFPEASAVLLEGRLRSAHESKAQFRRRVLENGGIDTSTLTTVDALDAALAALTGTLALEGNFSTVGEPDEGVIVLPVSTLPQTKLLRPPPSATTHLRAELAGHHPACPRRESANAVALRRYADAFSLATTPSSSHDCVVSRRREWMRRPTNCALSGG